MKGTIDALTPESKEGKTKKPVKTSKAAKQAKPPVKAEKKEEPGILSKITESVTDTVKNTIDILTPAPKEAKKLEKKAVEKTAKKKIKPAKLVSELAPKEGEKNPMAEQPNTLRDTFKRLVGGDDKAEEKKDSKK